MGRLEIHSKIFDGNPERKGQLGRHGKRKKY
jgi:hypothetical protein